MRISCKSLVSPLRQMMRVLPVDGSLAAISSSISTLSLLAMITMRGFLRLALAIVSSEIISKIDGDQLKIIVWSFSSTSERPLRSSSSLLSIPALRTPISAETMKIPANVTSSITMRKPQPASPPIVPESKVRISDSHVASTKLNGWLPSGATWVTARNAPATAIIMSDISASQPISAIGPLAIVLSNS